MTRIIVIVALAVLVAPIASAEITAARTRAANLYVAVTGIRVSIDDQRVIAMEALINQNRERDAVKIATGDADFIEGRIQALAKRMSNRDETILAPLSDFVATFMGAVRDDTDARELLTGNFVYGFGLEKLTADQRRFLERDDVSNVSNMHYERATSLRLSPFIHLTKRSPQKANGEGAVVDAAGLLSTRSFMQAHTEAGTNRRAVEYSFREFLCAAAEDWMDVTRPDDWVARDVDRYAGGSTTRYLQTCKGCHAQIDGFRGAFAHNDFPNNSIVYTPTTIPRKYAQNAQIFPQGRPTTDNSWINYATGPANAERFGWRGDFKSGKGLNAFGKLIANSKGYSRCLSRRMFSEICKRDALPSEEIAIRSMANEFEKTYKLKDLAEIVAINSICLPVRGK